MFRRLLKDWRRITARDNQFAANFRSCCLNEQKHETVSHEYSKSRPSLVSKRLELGFRRMFRLIDRRFNKLRKSYEKLRNRLTKSRSAAGFPSKT